MTMSSYNWPLTIALIVACLPGVVTVAKMLPALLAKIPTKPDRQLPPLRTLQAASVAQTLVLISLATALGTAAAPRVGLQAPAFEALVAGQSVWAALAPEIGPAVLLGGIGAVIFITLYYGVFRPHLTAEEVKITEEFRGIMGLWGRLAYGGVVEEVMLRWGVMSVLAWLLSVITGRATDAGMWIAIIISGILFGLGHLPSLIAQGLHVSPWLLGTNLMLNGWAALIFSWLFWIIGLEAAMMAHALFHVIWYPFEMYHLRHASAAGG
jgi:hypothetical protein